MLLTKKKPCMFLLYKCKGKKNYNHSKFTIYLCLPYSVAESPHTNKYKEDDVLVAVGLPQVEDHAHTQVPGCCEQDEEHSGHVLHQATSKEGHDRVHHAEANEHQSYVVHAPSTGYVGLSKNRNIVSNMRVY